MNLKLMTLEETAGERTPRAAPPDNLAWMAALARAAKCSEWLVLQGYHLLSLEVRPPRDPRIRIAFHPRAMSHLDGANIGRVHAAGRTHWRYAATRHGCLIQWEVVSS